MFSQTNLNENPYQSKSWKGDKTMYIEDSNLFLSDSGDGRLVDRNLTHSNWHSLAFILQNKKPLVYIDGQLEKKRSES